MQAFACALAISLLGLSAIAEAAPARRVASLNLCTDEIVLAIAEPRQVISVTHLAQDPHDFAFWRSARRYPANDGSVVSVAGLRPDLIVTMGGLGRDRERLARRIGTQVIDLPFPMTIADVETSLLRIGEALGREERARFLARGLRAARVTAPARPIEAMFLSGGGLSLGASGLGSEWMAAAGLRQLALPGDRVPAERLLTDPPAVALRSDYRARQASRGNGWPGFRLLERARTTRVLRAEGRRWTCMGPSLLPEILRLRRELTR